MVTDFLIEIFNQPLQKQPKGILDMGCGNGAFIQHIYETIERHTLRGKNLEEHPLFLVGADYNNAALSVSRANLINNAGDLWICGCRFGRLPSPPCDILLLCDGRGCPMRGV